MNPFIVADGQEEFSYVPRRIAPRSARQRVEPGPMYDALVAPLRPFLGVRLADADPGDRVPAESLSSAARDIDAAKAVTDAAAAVLAAFDTDQRARTCQPVDSTHWQTWVNTHPNVFRHGVILEDLSAQQRTLVVALMRASLSERGFGQARDIMRINGLLVELSGRAEEFGEWPYFFTVFGTPGLDEPWGWQIDGHHLNLNVVVVDGCIVTSPMFMGSEPCQIDTGRLAGTQVLRAEHEAGLRFMRSLDAAQQPVATVRPSIRTSDLPIELQHPITGRSVAGPFRDNLVLGREGVSGADLSPAQRRLLHDAISTYLDWSPPATAAVRRALTADYLDETSFAWMGDVADRGPFYYRILSPAVLIEFDHHAGTVFDNPDPTPNHIHTLVRTPLGGDYGVDLIRRHYERWDHTDGRHRPWS